MTWSDEARYLVGVIADDLTGCNATGILLRRRGFRTASLTGLNWPALGLVGYDCVSVNTESRALPAAEAYRRVSEAAALVLANQGRPMAKRIDSTLRGGLGPEIEAVLDALGSDSMAVVTGAYPASGRTTADGYHYVNGVLLADTNVRHDPLCPVTESHVPTLLAGQTKYGVGYLPLKVAREGAEAVAELLIMLKAQGVRMVCADAETDADILALGLGMVMSGLNLVAADPGPLTAAYVAARVAGRRQRVLVVCGSVSPNSREQMDRLEAEMGAQLVTVDAGLLALGGDTARAEVDRVVTELAALPHEAAVVGMRTGPLLTLPDHSAAEQIAAGFAEIAARGLERMQDIAGLYTSGGDITIAVCRRLGAGAVNLVQEVMPLAVSGRLLGGQHPGLPIVTKGGLVGGPDAALTCVGHILKEVESRD